MALTLRGLSLLFFAMLSGQLNPEISTPRRSPPELQCRSLRLDPQMGGTVRPILPFHDSRPFSQGPELVHGYEYLQLTLLDPMRYPSFTLMVGEPFCVCSVI